MERAQYRFPPMKVGLTAALLLIMTPAPAQLKQRPSAPTQPAQSNRSVVPNVAPSPLTGREMAQKVKGNVVRIEARLGDRTENGFGFIVGQRGETLYIVTAYHVVADPQDVGAAHPATVNIELFDHQGEMQPATLLGTHDVAHDLAVLTVRSPPRFRWFYTCEGNAEHQKVMTNVWFVGRSQGWFVPPSPGNISSDMPVDERIDIDQLSIRPGSSGAPLVASSGIIGMVLRDSADQAQALTIGFIKARFRQWNHPWFLRQAGDTGAPPAAPPHFPGGPEYATYTDPIYGFTVPYPKDLLHAVWYDRAKGTLFESADRKAGLNVYAGKIDGSPGDGANAAAALQRERETLAVNPDVRITAAVGETRGYTISYERQSRSTVFIRKVIFAGNVKRTVDIYYDAAQRNTYADIVEHILRGFQP